MISQRSLPGPSIFGERRVAADIGRFHDSRASRPQLHGIRPQYLQVTNRGEFRRQLEPAEKHKQKQHVATVFRSHLRVICATPIGKRAS